MKTNTYAGFVRHGNFTEGLRDAQFLAALGLNGEAGEVSEIIKKHLLHGKELDMKHLKEELGDVLWYFFHALSTYGLTFEEIAEGNLRKLCARHPGSNGDPEEWLRGDHDEGISIEDAREIAAQCWTDPETEHVEMDVNLANAFAKRLVALFN